VGQERLDFNEARSLYLATFTYSRSTRLPISLVVVSEKALQKLEQVLNIHTGRRGCSRAKGEYRTSRGDLPRAAALLAPLHPNADTPTPWEHK